MNSIVAHYSRFGNTEEVAREIAGEFQSTGLKVRRAGIGELPPMEGIDLLVVGSPTHKMNLPGEVREALGELPDGILRGIPVAAYDTSYRMNWLLSRFTASGRLEKALRRLGGKRVDRETFHVVGREGPLCAGEVERARAWAREILDRLEHQAVAGAVKSPTGRESLEPPDFGGSGAGRL